MNRTVIIIGALGAALAASLAACTPTHFAPPYSPPPFVVFHMDPIPDPPVRHHRLPKITAAPSVTQPNTDAAGDNAIQQQQQQDEDQSAAKARRVLAIIVLVLVFAFFIVLCVRPKEKHPQKRR